MNGATKLAEEGRMLSLTEGVSPKRAGDMRPIRILQGVVANDGGGLTGYICQNYRFLDRRRFQFDFITYDEHLDFEATFSAMGARFFHIPRPSHPLAHYRALRAIVRTVRPDILHLNLSYANIVQLGLARLAGFPIIIAHSHSTGFDEARWQVRFVKSLVHRAGRWGMSQLADAYFACSMLAAAWMFPTALRQSPSFYLAHNAIDLDRFAYRPELRAKERKALGIPADSLVLGHVGRFTYQKNHEFLLDIFVAVHQAAPNTHLLLIGEGPLKTQSEAKVRALGLASAVHFLGYRKDIAALYQAIDCVVLPSRFEGLCIVAIEAQAAGLPCVCSDALPEETRLTPMYRSLSLEEAVPVWRDCVLEAVRKPRMDTRRLLSEHGYDVRKEILCMQKKYETLLHKDNLYE